MNFEEEIAAQAKLSASVDMKSASWNRRLARKWLEINVHIGALVAAAAAGMDAYDFEEMMHRLRRIVPDPDEWILLWRAWRV